MGIVSKLLGNAHEITAEEGSQLFGPVLLPEEQVAQAYRLFRDAFVFTSWRLIFMDKQGLSGSKVEYHSLPYRSISHFSIETAGSFDLDAELKIFISGNANPTISKRFTRKLNIYDVGNVLSRYVQKASWG